MEIAEQLADGITVVEVKGRIDSNSAKAFEQRLVDMLGKSGARAVVDLKNVMYISSAGFRALLIIGRRAEDTASALVLCNLSAEVRRLFDLGAFTDMFTISGTREEGLSKLS